MKNKNLLIIGAVVIAAFFFFKKKKTTTTNGNPILPADGGNLHPIDMLADTVSNSYPSGITEGMRVLADNGNEQQIIENGKRWGLTYDQWAKRGFDSYTVFRSDILDLIPYGGVYNNGI